MSVTTPTPPRVTYYIDGFNLYHGLTEHTKTRDYKWLNLWELALDLLLPNHALDRVVYFTSVPPWNAAKARRHETYISAVESFGVVETVRGHFQHDDTVCRATCGELYQRPVEKLTDVNIATRILRDGISDKFDWAYLVSADSDQAPTLSTLRAMTSKPKVRVIFPPRRRSTELRQLADACMGEITPRTIRRNQLPHTITRGKRTIQIPSEWVKNQGSGPSH